MKGMRGIGRVYQPKYRDRKSKTWQTSAVWWIQYNFRGDTYREGSHSRNRPDAVKLLKRRLSEMGQGRLVGPDIERTTFEDLARILVDDYVVNERKSLETAKGSLASLARYFKSNYARDITLDRLNAYVKTRLEGGRRPATIRNELAALKRAFHLAQRAGKAICPLFPILRVQNARKGFFEEAEFRAVLAGLPEELRALVTFLYLTGWRVSEALELKWAQVDFVVGIVRLEVGETKNDEGRVFPFSVLPDLETLLRSQRDHTKAVERATGQIIPHVFHRVGKPIQDFRGAWAQACIAAGLYRIDAKTDEKKPSKLVHDFRRTAVRALVRAGVPERVAMVLTGHRTRSVFDRYNIVNEADLREGVKKLAAFHEAQAEKVAPRTLLPFAQGERAR